MIPRTLYFYTIALTFLGVIIHALGICGITVGDTPLWLHVLMLVVDCAVVVGLILKSKWRYWLAVVLYVGSDSIERGRFVLV